MSRSNVFPCRARIILIVVTFLALRSTTASAQSNSPAQPPGQQSFQLQVQSNLVLVRIVVRNKNGEPVRGLKKEDFRLFDQGKEQTISQFEEVPSGLTSVRSPAPVTPGAASPAGTEQRYIAFYFDEFNSSEANLIQARDAADGYLAKGLQPNDHVAIFTAEKILSNFTSDPHQIHDALMQLHASTRGLQNEHLCPDLSDYQAYQLLQSNDTESDAWKVAITEAAACPVKAFASPNIDPSKPNPGAMQALRMMAQRIVDRAQNLTRANLQQFAKVVQYVSQAPGQRSVVLVSPGFLSQSEQYTLDRIIDRALHAQVVINSLDPKGLALLMRESQASVNTIVLPDPRASQDRNLLDASKEFVGADVLSEVADGTGGEFFHSDNDLKAGFAALAEDPPHYILAFSPQNVKWDGKFHPLKVTFTIKEKGRTIQARRGYFAVQNPVSSEQLDSANNASGSQPLSGSTEAAKPPILSQPSAAIAGAIPQPSAAAPVLGPVSVYSSVANVNNPEDSIVRVPAPSPLPVLPKEASGRNPMPDPAQGLVRVDVTVTDKSGKPVSGLSEKDFKLLDNDQERKVVTFQAFDGAMAQPASSHEVALVIDELNMVPRIKEGHGSAATDPMHAAKAREEQAFANAVSEVEKFLRANGGVLEEPTIIYRITADGLFATPHVSMNGNELADEIENPAMQRQIWSSSEVAKDIANMAKGGAVSWRISHSLVALGSIAIEERRRPGRKLLFWIGNGWQIESRKMLGLSDFSIELLTRMREARISLWGASEWPLYDSGGNAYAGPRLDGQETAVGDYWPVQELVLKEFLAGPRHDSTDLRYLSLPVIAARDGGGLLDVPHNLAEKLRARAKEEGTYYSLTFDPPRTNAIDEYHHLKIEIDNPDLTAHFWKDYYDEPVFYDQPLDKQRVTVRQLHDVIAKAHDTSGPDLSQQLDGLQLTERLSSTKLAELQKLVHGKKAREAFQVVADESAFLAPPPDELPSAPAPDITAQQQMISQILSYISTAIPGLPNLFATRTTVQYHEPEPKSGQTWKTAFPDQSLQEGETAMASIRFQDGQERVQIKSVKNTPDQPGSEQLETTGTFGPILATVVNATFRTDSEIKWVRWEQGENGPLAVFRYHVPRATTSFSAEFCCLAYDFDAVRFKQPAPFHGEITVNPSTGAIMRMTIQADLPWRLPLHESDVMVEYELIQRGSRTFICPARSVSISRQRRTFDIDEWGEGFRVYSPFETLLNEMRFEKYRIFGSTSRILPGFIEVPQSE